MVAFWAHNPLVVGSIPIPATKKDLVVWKNYRIFNKVKVEAINNKTDWVTYPIGKKAGHLNNLLIFSKLKKDLVVWKNYRIFTKETKTKRESNNNKLVFFTI